MFLTVPTAIIVFCCSTFYLFLNIKGHTETIFCCEFQPDNCDMLATASFDGTVKIWDVTTMDVVSLLL